ncbi:hypothetical protein AB0284_17730 [Pseudarthrobacter phenanthrenivorans]|uniref:hypothetical protein n=1 Tax=Pseudarthrobacter phenanthrenivorans TaxID=361575 RepID=UPI00344F821E
MGTKTPACTEGVDCIGTNEGACTDAGAIPVGSNAEGTAKAGALNPAMMTVHATTAAIISRIATKTAETGEIRAEQISLGTVDIPHELSTK